MVDGPDVRIPNLAPVRPPGVTGISGGAPSKSEAGAATREVHQTSSSAVRTGLDSLELTTPSSITEMPLSILSDAILTRSEWGWRRFLSDFAAELRAIQTTTGNLVENHAEDKSLGPSPHTSEAGQFGKQSVYAKEEATGGSVNRAQVAGQQLREGQVLEDRTNLSLQQALNAIRAMQERELGAQGGPREAQRSTTQSPDFTKIVVTMRQVLDHVASMPEQQIWQVNWPRHVDSPKLMPFATVTHEDVPNSVLHPLSEWTLMDRLNTAVQDAGGPMFGGGLCLVPSPVQDSSRAIRWRAHRSSYLQDDGKKVHRLVVDIQVRDRPARVTIVSIASQLAVHLETSDNRLRATVPSAEQDLSHALLQSGFVLQSLSVGDYRGQGGSSNEP